MRFTHYALAASLTLILFGMAGCGGSSDQEELQQYLEQQFLIL